MIKIFDGYVKKMMYDHKAVKRQIVKELVSVHIMEGIYTSELHQGNARNACL